MMVLIDTNVILDYVLRREPFADTALRVLDTLLAGKEKVWLTASTVTDIYYVTRRTLRDAEKAKRVVEKLLNAFQVSGVDKTDCLNALDVEMSDYEDALVSVCAKKVKAEYIITRNLKDFVNSPVPAIDPQDFLNKYSPEA